MAKMRDIVGVSLKNGDSLARVDDYLRNGNQNAIIHKGHQEHEEVEVRARRATNCVADSRDFSADGKAISHFPFVILVSFVDQFRPQKGCRLSDSVRQGPRLCYDTQKVDISELNRCRTATAQQEIETKFALR
jgi:hypothetical protein